MMSPLRQTLCCVLGLAAAGVPLLHFTAPATPAPAAASAAAAAAERVAVPAALRCSGRPLRVRVWQQGKPVGELLPQQGCWQGTLELCPASLIELEVEASWEPAATAEALTLELTPPGLPSRQDTQWALPPDSHELHSIFTFSWQ